MRTGMLATVLAAYWLVAGTGNSPAEEPAADAASIAGAVYLGDAPTVIAEARGFFSQQGVRAQVVYLDSGKQGLARMRAGKADFALTALTPLVLDRLADETPGGADDPVILASLVHSSDLLQVVTPGDSSIRLPSDFNGKRVAINRGTNTEFVWWLYEQYHGLDAAAVELIDLSFADMPHALESGHADAAILWEPVVSNFHARSRSTGKDQPGQIQLDHLYSGKWVLVASRRTVRERRVLCRKLLRAYQQAINFIEGSPEQAVEVYRRQLELTGEVDTPLQDLSGYDLSLDWSLIAGLQEQLYWAGVAGYDNVSGRPVRVLEFLEPGPLLQEWPGTVGIPAAGPDRAKP